MTSLADLVHRALGPDATVERELPGGGMARVIVARDHALSRRVVVKILARGVIAPRAADRFRREIQLAIDLQHPHIVPILAAGLSGDQPYLIMPFIEGGSLRDRLAQGRLTVVEAVRVLRAVALALAHAHARGVVHRDIKPDNVLLAGGTAMVADFGIAKAIAGAREVTPTPGRTLTQTGTSLGTPAYMAPEQIVADPEVDHRADIYGFGATAYELLTGTPPFTGHTLQRLYTEHLTETPAPLARHRPDVPVRLSRLILACLAKEPSERPQSADELVAALDHPDVISGAFDSLPDATANTGHPAPPRRKPSGWLRWAAPLGIALLLAAILLPRIPSPSGSPAAAAAAPPVLAVLPLAYIGADSSRTWLADGVADAMTSALAGLNGVRGISRTAAAALQTRLARGEGRDTAVSAYLEGAVQEDDGQIRVALRLVRSADGVMLWGGLVSAPADSLPELAAEASAAAMTAIRTRLLTGEER